MPHTIFSNLVALSAGFTSGAIQPFEFAERVRSLQWPLALNPPPLHDVGDQPTTAQVEASITETVHRIESHPDGTAALAGLAAILAELVGTAGSSPLPAGVRLQPNAPTDGDEIQRSLTESGRQARINLEDGSFECDAILDSAAVALFAKLTGSSRESEAGFVSLGLMLAPATAAVSQAVTQLWRPGCFDQPVYPVHVTETLEVGPIAIGRGLSTKVFWEEGIERKTAKVREGKSSFFILRRQLIDTDSSTGLLVGESVLFFDGGTGSSKRKRPRQRFFDPSALTDPGYIERDITTQLVRDITEALGDPNIIHMSKKAAQALGLNDTPLPGMGIIGFAERKMPRVDPQGRRRVKATFYEPIYPKDLAHPFTSF